MASDVAAIERLAEQPIGVDPRAIEDEFNRIWRETAADGSADSSTRVRVLNLVALASTDDETERFERVMALLPQRQPCRGILVRTATDQPAITATLAAHCWRPASGVRRQVCSEEILLASSPDQARDLASIVVALLVPDLPVAAWFTGAPDLSGYLPQRLIHAADSMVLDSARVPDPRPLFADALAAVEEHDVSILDLAWVRLGPWRALLAQCFDGDAAAELERVRSIEIAGGGGVTSSEPLLFAAWLIGQLGMAPADTAISDGRLDATLYDGTRGVRLTIAPASDDSPLAQVVVRTDAAEVRVECHAESRHMHVRQSWGGEESRRIVEQPPTDDAAVLASALDGDTDGALYDTVARTALILTA